MGFNAKTLFVIACVFF